MLYNNCSLSIIYEIFYNKYNSNFFTGNIQCNNMNILFNIIYRI